MLGFFIFAIAFVALLTLVVRFGQLRVRADLRETRALGLTLGFVGLMLLTWWFVTRGAPLKRAFFLP